MYISLLHIFWFLIIDSLVSRVSYFYIYIHVLYRQADSATSIVCEIC